MPVDLPPDFFNRPLAEVDPEIADVLAHELERQQRTLEMIASENFVPRPMLECQGSVLTNKYAEGYRAPLLRGLRVGRRGRGAGHRAGQEIFGGDRQRAAARRRRDQRRRLLRADGAGRTRSWALSPRRPPHARHEDQLLRPPLQRRRLRGDAPRPPGRHGRGARARARAPAQGHRGGLVGLPAPARFRGLPRDRRRGRAPI